MKILIKNGRLIDPVNKVDKKTDVLIEHGKIARIGPSIKENDAKTIDAKNKIVAPGFIDMHTHLREPGREDAETIETGLASAIAGGFTSVCAMPNTSPPCQTRADAQFLIDRASALGMARLMPVGAITKKRAGQEIIEMAELKGAGCPAVSDDGDSVADPELMRRAMEYASMVDLLVISHCEDKGLAGDGMMHEGYWSTVLGLSPIPAAAEIVIVERDIRLAELTGARLHIAHVSCAESVDIIKRAKKRGVAVTAEVTPHHFSLTDEDVRSFDTSFKVNPPLRAKDDVAAMRQGLKDGAIDVIATDHAPHPDSDKEKEFDYAPFGMIGLETALSLSVVNLIEKGILDWTQLIEKLSSNPARILKCDGGSLKEGSTADVVIIDPEAEWTYTKDEIRSKSKNSPFIGKKMKARAECVIVGGVVVKE
jgi:dihydroorotase